jgi:hypothetical protein
LEVDHAAAEAWGHIFNPGEDDPLGSLKTYLEHFGQTAAAVEEFPLPPWDVQQCLDFLREASDKAAGLDGWAPRHWKHLTPKAARWLLVLFTLVETDAPWPAPL